MQQSSRDQAGEHKTIRPRFEGAGFRRVRAKASLPTDLTDPATLRVNTDILDLRDFYASRLGEIAVRSLAYSLAPVWKPIHDERLVGLGYAVPYLERLTGDADRTLCFMPAAQGAVNWPFGRPSLVALVHPPELPLGDASVDRILMVHALEFAENPGEMLSEAWRVLAPGGRIVLVLPNRRGVWARFEHTPFGSGRPWSRGQATSLLRETMFTPSGFSDALHFPPFRRAAGLRVAGGFERVGRRFWPLFCGAIIIEATKLVYRGIPVTTRERQRLRAIRPVLVPQGAPAPALNREPLDAGPGDPMS
ncbi:Methyltransferase domain-containing protein [Aureimonas jatrophae]|uniref:Methyltransferase domain-containing protein n=1 Tax=Aureimonas jatrophae TaxID=1166073 RepID=A0A1H0IB56_9HYPH|nr:Methyltransferase domain-containing protein [Aureimonas jatrophae]